MHAHGYRFRRRTGVSDCFVSSQRSGRGVRYRAWLFARHQLPAYLTFYVPFLRGPVKRMLKRVLGRLGVLDAVRSLPRRGD